jgi:acetylornithine deacetylase/succinyl-diaminopimelate desuccinylase-like protein
MKVKDETFNPPHSTVNFGKISQTPGGLSLHFDLRLLPDLVPASIEQHVQKGIQAIAGKYSNLIVSVARERSHPGLNMPVDHELVKICQESMSAVGIDPLLDCKSTSTEAAHYFQSGYESVVFGSGLSIGNSHGPNEYNLLDQIEKSVAFYEKLIERTCL